MTRLAGGNTTQTHVYMWWSADGTTMIPVTLDNPFPVNIVTGGGSGGTASNFGSTFPTVGTAIGAKDPSGNMASINVDSSGNLLISGSISATNPSVGTNGSTAPTNSTELGFISSGNLVGVSSSNPLPITGSISASNPSVSTTGTAVPSSATYVGMTVSGDLIGLEGTANGLKVDGSAVTQPVSGTFWQTTQPVSISTLPLPAGSATSALQITGNNELTAINTTLGSPFQAGGSISNTSFASTQSGSWDVGVIGTVAVSGTFWQTTQPISAASLPLPIGAATSALQTTGNTSLTSIITNTANAGTPTLQSGSTTAATQSTASNLNAQVVGATASGSSLSANPLVTGGRAATANPTAVSNGQAVDSMYDPLGKTVTVDALRLLKSSQYTSLSASTSETTIVTSGGSGVFNDLYGLVLTNSGATATQVDIRNTTGGSIITSFFVPAGDTRGLMLPAGSGYSQITANTNWTAQCGASTSSLLVTALFVKNTA